MWRWITGMCIHGGCQALLDWTRTTLAWCFTITTEFPATSMSPMRRWCSSWCSRLWALVVTAVVTTGARWNSSVGAQKLATIWNVFHSVLPLVSHFSSNSGKFDNGACMDNFCSEMVFMSQTFHDLYQSDAGNLDMLAIFIRALTIFSPVLANSTGATLFREILAISKLVI